MNSNKMESVINMKDQYDIVTNMIEQKIIEPQLIDHLFDCQPFEYNIYKYYKIKERSPPEWFCLKYPNSEDGIYKAERVYQSYALVHQQFTTFYNDKNAIFDYISTMSGKYVVYGLNERIPNILVGRDLLISDISNMLDANQNLTEHFRNFMLTKM